MSDFAETADNAERTGIYAIVGRPNVGKSTLLNRLIGQKISITSRKPQTTRLAIRGIALQGAVQLVFTDTPGWEFAPKYRLHKLMNAQFDEAVQAVDSALLVVDAAYWHPGDEAVAERLTNLSAAPILVLNKIDTLASKEDLLPLIERLSTTFNFQAIFPVCAKSGKSVDQLLKFLADAAPTRPHLFDTAQITDRSERFLCGEIIREKLMRQTGAELPYSSHVVIERFEEHGETVAIDATIWVEKPGQKAIVIGRQGARLKEIGTAARADIEKMLGRRVFLTTWVKIRDKWTEDPAALRTLDE